MENRYFTATPLGNIIMLQLLNNEQNVSKVFMNPHIVIYENICKQIGNFCIVNVHECNMCISPEPIVNHICMHVFIHFCFVCFVLLRTLFELIAVFVGIFVHKDQ